jgi:electron transfer flavoprotein alpha subunit
MGNITQKQGRILVLIEREDQGIASITFELLGMGKRLANGSRRILCAAVLGHKLTKVSSEIAYFADEVYFLDHALLERFEAEAYASGLEQLCRNVNPDIVLMGHSLNGQDLSPRLAYKMGVQVISDCIDLAFEPGTEHLHCTKPVYGAKIIAHFKLDRKPYIVTLRSKVIEPIGSSPAQGKVIHFNPVIDESLAKVELIERIEEESISLGTADAIVAGGRGIKNDEGFAEGLDQLKELVRVLTRYFRKVELGASRPLVDAGSAPSSRQIGLTGEKVAPELYVAVGISGSLQHLTGMLGSKKIIAINNNRKAPIFEVSHYGVIGNYQDVVPAFIKKLEELL